MNNTKLISLLLLVVLAAAVMFFGSSCSSIHKGYHRYTMRGSVIEVNNSDVYVCIGSKDSAAVGQELNVYRIVKISRSPRELHYGRQFKGKVKIIEIIDEYSARAKVISGMAAENDIVELILAQ